METCRIRLKKNQMYQFSVTPGDRPVDVQFIRLGGGVYEVRVLEKVEVKAPKEEKGGKVK
jgi:hypothetical protein